jgi:hypothetical protein
MANEIITDINNLPSKIDNDSDVVESVVETEEI